MTLCDVLIRGGEVIDPSQQWRGIMDVAVTAGRITAVAPQLTELDARHSIDARGLYVVPGLIDLHVHVYPHSPFGLDPDPLCPAGGVTTMLDAGTAGSLNFEAYHREIVCRSRTRVLSLINLSCMGLAAGNRGELCDPRFADPEGVVRLLREYSETAVGVKIRAGKHIIGDGQQGWDHLRMALAAARESGTWLMVHIGECPMSIPELVAELEPGDCITHCYKGGTTRICDDDNRIHDAVRHAADRGVIFDVGHGYGSFQWDVVESAIEQGFEPTTISTDLHTRNIHGPVFDMPTTMSKFLMLGLSLERVIEMSTLAPARVLGRAADLGTLKVGTTADIALLERRAGQFKFWDSYRQTRIGHE
ncbi:MAG: amidohydrolase/deacetylase family metallohydrolase, partial [Planctomycetaceae bacterium]